MCSCLIIGCGYLGRRVAALEHARGNPVSAIVRTMPSVQALTQAGIHALAADLDHAGALDSAPLLGQLVYYFAPPPAAGRSDPRMQQFVRTASDRNRPQRVVLISTTGVYGDCGGEWIDESRPPQPQTDRARRRLAAEQTLGDWGLASGVAVVILRVAGIYGPRRLPEQRLRERQPVLIEAQSPFSNRVHVTDLARACCAAAQIGEAGAIYNIVDGHPTSMTDYFNRVADALGLPRPPQIDTEQAQHELSAGMRSYLSESKRIGNRRMREELGVIPDYPDLASGLSRGLRE